MEREEGELILIVVPGEPVGKQRARTFLHRQSGRIVSMTPAKTKHYEDDIRSACIAKYAGFPPIEGAVKLRLNIYRSIPVSTSKKRAQQMEDTLIRPTTKPDIDNCAKIVLDALSGLCFHDDSQVVHLQVDKYYSRTPRVEVYVEKWPQ